MANPTKLAQTQMLAPRIALIHATPLAMAPIQGAFARLWPEAQCANLLDDSLSADLSAAGELGEALTTRFVQLAQYSERTGARAILFTCSAFGAAIEAAAASVAVPTHKPNYAMFREAISTTPAAGVLRIGLLSTFEPSIASMSDELLQLACANEVTIELKTAFVPDAMSLLAQGDGAAHDRLIASRSTDLQACDVVMLGQFSMARAQQMVQAAVGKPVLTSPDSAVRLLKSLCAAVPADSLS
ncbi:hydantoin racemase [Variovorax sp. J22R133]|uniref:aspartate/glutamate racemase family protein n=1 Tax=Variovorax brevis TaxID=3053503 RepID=UPI0025754E6B|nr:aspartate/glutamate racemase family protein [Variovorax sp. J22R133]MDM0114140.1 hydantoin racemase [Variovorax sp. J22R133]